MKSLITVFCIAAIVAGAIILIRTIVSPNPSPPAAVETLTVPPRPLTAGEKAFDTFGEIWQVAYNNYNIELFERGVKGNRVAFEGTCGGADRTGTQFDLVPRNQPTPRSNFEAVVVLRGKPLPAKLREPGARVRVTGHISSVTISDVFIIAEKIEVL